MMNLIKYISFCGAASRREAEKAVRAGNVAVNGCTERNPARRVSDCDDVQFFGVPLHPVSRRYYVLLHKPRGYVCSNSDVHAEHLAVELINIPGVRMVSAGRLDKDSEGAIIFSNDGEFINFLAHPRYEVLKKYQVDVSESISDRDLQRMCTGIVDDNEMLKARSVRKIGDKHYEFILNEGKKREIRRLVAACGSRVIRLVRVEIGNIALGDLPAGKFRELSEEEVNSLIFRNGKNV